MARKRPPAPPVDPDVPLVGEDPDAPDELLRSRTSLKNERVQNERALAKLARELLPLNIERWQQLGVPDRTIDTLLDAQKMRGNIAPARQLRLVRATLRDADWTRIRRRLDDLAAGFAIGGAPAQESSRAQEWAEQLLIQSDPGLARFCEEYPDVDRQRVRQLIRNVQRAPASKKAKARTQLDRAVEQVVAHAEQEAGE